MTIAVRIPKVSTPLQLNLRNLLVIFLVFAPGLSPSLSSVLPIVAFFLLAMVHGSIRHFMLNLLLGLLLLSLAVTVLRSLVGVAPVSARDLTEIIRLLALLTTAAVLVGATEAQFARRLLLAVLLADLLISLSQLQILPVSIADAFSRVYQSDFHLENALGVSGRALGLFTDPTTHGLAIGLLVVFFLGDTVNGKGALSLIALLTAMFLVALAQSQTAFIATVLGMITFFLFNIITRPTLGSILLLGALLGGALSMLMRFADELSYLFLLFKIGLERSSYQRRIQKREGSLEVMHNEPVGVVLGWGKDYLGGASAALDNEYLFVYLIYGLPGLLLFLAALAAVTIYGIRTKSHVLLAATLLGAIAAYPASFFTNLKTFTLFCLVASATIGTNKLPSILKRLR